MLCPRIRFAAWRNVVAGLALTGCPAVMRSRTVRDPRCSAPFLPPRSRSERIPTTRPRSTTTRCRIPCRRISVNAALAVCPGPTVTTPTLMMSRSRIQHLYANGVQRTRVSESGPRAKGQMSRSLVFLPKSRIIDGTGPYMDATLLIVIEAGVDRRPTDCCAVRDECRARRWTGLYSRAIANERGFSARRRGSLPVPSSRCSG